MEKHIKTRKDVYHNFIDFKGIRSSMAQGFMAKHGQFWDISRDYRFNKIII